MEIVFGSVVLLLLVAIIYCVCVSPQLSGTWTDGQTELVITKNKNTYNINGTDYKLLTIGEDSVLYDENRNSIPFKFTRDTLILGFGTTNQFILKR